MMEKWQKEQKRDKLCKCQCLCQCLLAFICKSFSDLSLLYQYNNLKCFKPNDLFPRLSNNSDACIHYTAQLTQNASRNVEHLSCETLKSLTQIIHVNAFHAYGPGLTMLTITRMFVSVYNTVVVQLKTIHSQFIVCNFVKCISISLTINFVLFLTKLIQKLRDSNIQLSNALELNVGFGFRWVDNFRKVLRQTAK